MREERRERPVVCVGERDERREARERREASERGKERTRVESREFEGDESRRGAAAPLQHASRVGSRKEVKNKVV